MDGIPIVGGNNPHNSASVNSDGQLQGASISVDERRWVSDHKEQAYTAQFSFTISGAGTSYPMAIKNTHEKQQILVFDLTHQWFGLTTGTRPGTGDYFQTVKGQTFSGGSAVTAWNMNIGSSNEPEATLLNSNPTPAGTEVAGAPKLYLTDDAGVLSGFFNGSLVVPPGTWIAVKLVTTATTGTVVLSPSFAFRKKGQV